VLVQVIQAMVIMILLVFDTQAWASAGTNLPDAGEMLLQTARSDDA